ncbi:MAG: hypothetical protein WBG41_13000 [Acidimicrobiales bacterium]
MIEPNRSIPRKPSYLQVPNHRVGKRHRMKRARLYALGLMVIIAFPTVDNASNSLSWMGHEWTITNGSMAGIAPGDAANVSLTKQGYLQLQVVRHGSSVTAAQLFSQDVMGFGTYQWQIQGPVDSMPTEIVLGLFPYGPADGIGQNGENEIDIEFSKWRGTLCGGACNADFAVYPSSGHGNLKATQDNFLVKLARGNLVTARLTWTSTSITETVMSGLQPMGTTNDVLHTWTFEPSNPEARIPQQAVPLGMNLWCYEAKPSHGQKITIRSFQFDPT